MLNRKNQAFFLCQSAALNSAISTSQDAKLYDSLNFLTYSKIRQYVLDKNLNFDPNTKAFYELANRALIDPELKNRHKVLSKILYIMKLVRVLSLTKLFPASYQPIMDVRIRL